MGTQDFCLCEKKAQISFAVSAKLISAFVCASRLAEFLFFFNPKFQASSLLLSIKVGLCQNWSEILKTDFLSSRLICRSYCVDNNLQEAYF